MRGILNKLYSNTKNERSRQVEEVPSQIAHLENQNEQAPSHKLASELLDQRHKLRLLLLVKFENNLKLTKAKYYALGNKAGALLGLQVKAQRTRCKIASLHHPTTNQLFTNPQDITNAFSDFFSLYNLTSDKDTPQPSDPSIQSFLSSIDLPNFTPA